MEMMSHGEVKDRMWKINKQVSERAAEKGLKYAIDAMTVEEMHEYTILLAREEALNALTEDKLELFCCPIWGNPGIRGHKFIAVDSLEAYRKQFPESVMTQEQLDASRLTIEELREITRLTKALVAHYTASQDRKYEEFEHLDTTLGDTGETQASNRTAKDKCGAANDGAEEARFSGDEASDTINHLHAIFTIFGMR
jgi:hypothetical protein